MVRRNVISLFIFFSIASNASAQTCAGNPVAVQILGSGGPAINTERASAGYLLWVGAQAKLLFDIGGGTYIRFGQSGCRCRHRCRTEASPDRKSTRLNSSH